MAARLRISDDGTITIVQEEDGTFRVATQWDMDHLEVGEDLTEDEIERLDG
jgi:hypothetical protein